jgi:hypothetical protein
MSARRGYKRSVQTHLVRTWLATAGAVVWLLSAATTADAQTRPLRTEEATTAPAGRILFETGFEAIAAEPSFLTGVERARWDGPLLRLVYSPADTVELDIEWVAAVGVLSAEDEPRTTDFGDITLRTKLRFFEGQGRQPTVAGRFGIVLPQTSYEDDDFRPLGLGPNTMRFFIEALLTQPLGPVRLDLNLGLFLHEDPTKSHDQLDFLSYGLAARWAVGSRWEIVAEVAGRAGEGKPGAGERSEARFGGRYSRGRLRFDAALRRGLLSEQGTWGGTVGLSWTIRPRS